MPEENFEQQARRLAEPFSMEPKPAVWQHIKTAIAPKRRRRALLWWWLLPVCVVSGVAVYLLQVGNSGKTDKLSLVVTAHHSSDTSYPGYLAHGESVDTLHRSEVTKVTEQSIYSSPDNSKKNADDEDIDRTSSLMKHPYFSFVDNGEKKSSFKDDNNKTQTTIKENNEAVTTLSPDAITKNEDNISIDSSLRNQSIEDKKANDSTTANAVIVQASADSAKTAKDKSLVTIHKKNAVKKSLSIGLLAEIGKASLNSPLAGNEEKVSQSLNAVTSGGLFDLSNGTVVRYKLSSGIDAAIGVSAQKQLSSAFSLTAQLTYRYQQFGVAQTVFIDTTTPGNINSPGSGRGIYYPVSAVQRLHIINAYTAFNWQFFARKHWSTSLQVGIDNGFLMSIQQLQSGSADSIKSLPIKNFYRWQPSFQVALPVDIYLAKKTRFELSPFVRFGIKQFQKNNASDENNRLSSAGIQLIYFFK